MPRLKAFEACAYVRWELKYGTCSSKLVISKTRVAPLKCMTIVNLELSAAVLASRIRKFITNESRYKIERCVHIIDSEVVKSRDLLTPWIGFVYKEAKTLLIL